MLVTTFLTSLVIILYWHKNVLLALFFLLFFGYIEDLYFFASFIKFLEGALSLYLSIFHIYDNHVYVILWHNKEVGV